MTQATIEPNLFTLPVDQPKPARVYHNRTDTSRKAAERAKDFAGNQEEQVKQIIIAAGSEGITRSEIAERHGLKIQSVCARVASLMGHEIADSGRRRDGGAVLVAAWID